MIDEVILGFAEPINPQSPASTGNPISLRLLSNTSPQFSAGIASPRPPASSTSPRDCVTTPRGSAISPRSGSRPLPELPLNRDSSGPRRVTFGKSTPSANALSPEPILSKPKQAAPHSEDGCVDGCWAGCKSPLALIPCLRRGIAPLVSRSSPAQKRWYRIHQIKDMGFYVRRDVGPDGQHKAPALEHVKPLSRPVTVPGEMERFAGMVDFQGFDRDAFNNDCRVCMEKPIEVITLPCRHGGLCEACFRRSLFSKPVHKGGRDCPFCRTPISEAVVILYEPGKPMEWAYGIKVD